MTSSGFSFGFWLVVVLPKSNPKPSSWAQTSKRWRPEGWEPEISRFFPPFPAPNFALFCSSWVFSFNCGPGSRPRTSQIARLGFSGVILSQRSKRPPGFPKGQHLGRERGKKAKFVAVPWEFGERVGSGGKGRKPKLKPQLVWVWVSVSDLVLVKSLQSHYITSNNNITKTTPG